MTFTSEKGANSSPSKHRLPPIRLGGNAINQRANQAHSGEPVRACHEAICRSEIERALVYGQRGFLGGFAQGRVGVANAGDIFAAGAVF